MRKEGLTIRDIAEEMHMSEGYVHKCIRRCWNHIQEKCKGTTEKEYSRPMREALLVKGFFFAMEKNF